MRRFWMPKRHLKVVGLLLIVLAVGFVCFDRDSWPKPVMDQIPHRPEALVVLGGGYHQGRSQLALAGIRSCSPRSVIVTGDGGRILRDLEASALVNVPLLHEPQATSTYENAVFTKKLLSARHARTVVIATHWYHSRRAKRTFQSVLGDEYEVFVYTTPRAATLSETERAMLRRERLALVYYAVRYGIFPRW